MTVTEGRVLLPSAGVAETAAFFHMANRGGSADSLIRVTSRDVPGGITLARDRMNDGNGAYRADVDAVGIPAGGSLAMSPRGVDLTLSAPTGKRSWSPGDLVPFTLVPAQWTGEGACRGGASWELLVPVVVPAGPRVPGHGV
ncbi:copper chaperone PCu(A)C [Streptomyces arenae]|uniref:copper chaperone PCu(A)C n=1 Tax=Streptomyces arenae TaxID=29301 RepID=UPI002659BF30|nr:copper chaperone PCu(A)C [Streptomyces arenae]MCG7206209.1 copper chaperone PCu(A)C [Streptomyces arenae]